VDRLTDNNPTGGGEGSGMAGDLRWCVIESLFRADTINFSVTGTINLAAALPTLARSVSIEGPGANLMTVRRNTGGDYRIFTIGAGATVGVSSLTMTNGDISGGGISNSGTLAVNNCIISGNTITGAGAGDGGGSIYSSGTLTVNYSTLSGNYLFGVGARGGGIVSLGTLTVNYSTISGNTTDGGGTGGGGILIAGMATVRNSTISGNTAGFGGGIRNIAGALVVSNSTIASNSGGGIFCNEGTLTVTNSTIAGNSTSGQGGGILASGAIATLNTIIAGNTAPAGPDVYGHLGSQGHNLIGNPQDMTGWVDTDVLHVNPLLGPLQDNGGPTKTMGLLAGSPALNAGDTGQLGVGDERGVVRAGGVNIGAYQASASAFVLTAPLTVTAGMPFDVTVKAVDTFGQTAIGYSGTVTFSTSDTNPSVALPAAYPFTAADAGMHTFPGMTALATAGSQTLAATDIPASITGSLGIMVIPGVADHLLFLQGPTDTAAGQTITPAVTVAVVDQFGNVLTDDNSDTVTISIGTNPSGGTLSGTLTVTVVNGIAMFSDLSIDQIGDGYTLHATVTGLTDADSAAFNITA
jgi:hypothetical protein